MAYRAHGLVVFTCYKAALDALHLKHPDATREEKRPWNVSGVQFESFCGRCLMWMMLEQSDHGSTLPCPVCDDQQALWDSWHNDPQAVESDSDVSAEQQEPDSASEEGATGPGAETGATALPNCHELRRFRQLVVGSRGR